MQILARLCLLISLLALAGCGGVDFFPAYKRLPTTPDPFSFTAATGVALNTGVTSSPITVTGLTGDSSQISVIGPNGSNSKYSINGAAATSAPGTVKNGDKVTVTHTSSSALGGSISSTLTIGDVNGTFTSTTQLVLIQPFSGTTVVGAEVQAFTTIQSVDGVIGTHAISIKDSLNSGRAQYSVGDANNNPTIFTNLPETVPVLNNVRIYVRNLPSTSNVTTLTIDNISQQGTLSLP